jgi:serine/threonine-protein phosphatase 2A activator
MSGTSMEPPQAAAKKNTFTEPQKLIKSAMDMANWEKSEAYYDLMGFVNSICFCIQGKGQSHKCHISPRVQKMLDLLDTLEKLAIETPPVQ